MRLPPRRVAAFLRDPGKTRVVLLYGDDTGLIRERAAAIVRAVLGADDDSFRLVTVAHPDEIPDEAAGASLGGGRRIVRVPATGDSARDAVGAVLESRSDAMVLLEASGLTPARSRLIKLIDANPDAVAIACYAATPETLTGAVRSWLAERRVSIDDGVLAFLASRLGADTAASRSEVEKLALYVGPGAKADLAAVQACVGDTAGLSLDDALFAATAGDRKTADRSLERALAEGTTAVAVIRAGLAHLQRLDRATLSMAAGTSQGDAAKEAHVFFRRVPAFTRALTLWTPEALAEVLAAFFQGEQDAKRTGVPAASLCRHLIAELADRASRG